MYGLFGDPLGSRLLFQSSGALSVKCVWAIGVPLVSRLLFQSSEEF